MKISKKLIAVGLGILIVLTGCSKTSNKKDTSKKNNDSKIVVYSNSVSEGRGDYLKEQAKKVGLKLELVDIGGGDLMNRLIAEKDASVADVVFGMNQMMFQKVADEGILTKFEPDWINKVDSSLVSSSHLYSPLQEQRVMMIYNEDKIKAKDAPKNWQDAAVNFKGKYLVPASLGGATPNAVVYSLLSNYRDNSGEMGISTTGWKQITTFFKNGVPLAQGQTPEQQLANGDVEFSYTWLSNIPVQEKALGIKIGVVNPSYGVPQTVEQVGIVKKGKVSPNVKKFVNLLGSADVQSGWAKKFGTAPVNKDAKSSIDKEIKRL